MQKKKLTGWLILLILWIGLFSFGGGAGSLRTIKDDYQPYMADYPSLPAAITIFQLFLGAGMAVWIYTAWVLYRREPGRWHRRRFVWLQVRLCELRQAMLFHFSPASPAIRSRNSCRMRYF